MKQLILSYTILGAALLTACNANSSASKKEADTALTNADSSKMMSRVKYTCTMHPEVISDTSGHCPKCGMDLVPIKDSTPK
jgi:hypothetical protein